MFKKVFTFSAVATIALTGIYDGMGLVGLGLLVGGFWLLLITSIVWMVAKAVNLVAPDMWKMGIRPIKYASLPALMGLICLLTTNLIAPSPLPSSNLPVSEEMAYIYDTDQGDRRAMRMLRLNNRDNARLERVQELYDAGQITDPQDKLWAAYVFQHGSDPIHFETAHKLANEAAAADIDGADWLVQATFDRWQLSLGLPQVYGTQTNMTIGLNGISAESSK